MGTGAAERRIGIVATALGGAVALALSSWNEFRSGFDAVPGHVGDTVLIVALLEHWRHVFEGAAAWRSPGFFFPIDGVLGYSDGYVAFAPPYTALRWIGFSPFGAFQGLVLALAVFGYIGAERFFRRTLGVGRWIAAAAAALATAASPLIVQAYHAHAQLLAVVLLPWIGLCAARAVRAPTAAARARAAVAAGALLGLTFLTAFYIAWFATFYAAIALALFALLLLATEGSAAAGRQVRATIAHWREIAAGLLAFGAAMLPFAALYAPALAELGGRKPETIRQMLPQPLDLLNVGAGHALWGDLWSRIEPSLGERPFAASFAHGIPPLTLAAFVAALFWAWTLRRAAGQSAAGAAPRVLVSPVLLAAATAVPLCWVLEVRIGDTSLWSSLIGVVPGASAIRVVARFQNVLVLPLAATLAWASLRLAARAAANQRRSVACLLALAWAVLLIEQAHARVRSFPKRAQLERLAAIGAPPPDCEVFYLAPTRPVSLQNPSDPSPAAWNEVQHVAMLVAALHGVPTVNGRSSWLPRGWALREPWAPGYEANVGAWAQSHDIARLAWCRLDLGARRWEAVTPPAR